MADDILNLTHEELDALIVRLEEAIEHNIALTPADCQLLLSALLTLATLQERLQEKNVTVNKLKKLLGIIRSSEKYNDLIKDSDPSDKSDDTEKPDTDKKKRPPKKKPKVKPVKPNIEHHKLTEQKKGDLCIECGKGTLGKYAPKELIRITGKSPFQATQHVQERLQCNACGAVVVAPLPDDVQRDGSNNQKYGYSARSIMGILKYFAGSPFYRQESVQQVLGVPITASSIFDQIEYLANDLNPILNFLINEAASACHFFQDDTGHRILDQKPIMKPDRRTGKLRERSGIYASGLIATLDDGHDVFLFKTNIGHAGEWLDEVLKHRDASLALPIIMSDALSSNKTLFDVVRTYCNAHSRRGFVEQIDNYPDEVKPILEMYKGIWINNTHCTERVLSPQERQKYHHQHSLPIMEQIKQTCETALEKDVEHNSGLGKAMKYFINHYDGLSAFCHRESAQLDNNKIEQTLKLVIRNRKNSLFYKTATGAAISDVITSMIATTYQAEINTFDYFNAVQRFSKEVKSNPEKWLPWNYELENAALLAS